MAVVGRGQGGILVYARPAPDDKSDIFGRLLDADGKPKGPARLLRRTSGKVEALDISWRNELWVAWASNVGEKILTAVVKVGWELDSVSAPITIVHEGFGSSEPGYWVRLLAVYNGGAVVATRGTSAPIKCMFQAQQPNERCTAGTYVVAHVAPDGKQALLARRPLDGNPIEMAPLVDIEGAVVVRAYGWHGGAVFDDQVLPYLPEGGSKQLTLTSCRPPFEQVFFHHELITLCEADYLGEKEKCPNPKAEGGMCSRIHRASERSLIDGDGSTGSRSALVRSIKTACRDGGPVIEVVNADGSPFVIPQLRGFTGKVLVEVDTSNREGSSGPLTLKRRACRGNALVDLPP